MGDIVRIGQCRNMAADRYLNVETNRTIPDTLGCINVRSWFLKKMVTFLTHFSPFPCRL